MCAGGGSFMHHVTVALQSIYEFIKKFDIVKEQLCGLCAQIVGVLDFECNGLSRQAYLCKHEVDDFLLLGVDEYMMFLERYGSVSAACHCLSSFLALTRPE